MKLRRWQSEAISQAYSQYSSGIRHFLCLATPGAGKTIMAAILAKRLFEAGMIDLVMCFSPAIVVAKDFQKELEAQTGKRLGGQLGDHGCSLTYQAMISMATSFWETLKNHRVFVIFDEIHHCAATEEGNSNSWGEAIYRHINEKSAYSLALTGTPWRSDNIPIVLADYCKESNRVHCDYRYGLAQAITDNVCREPSIIAIDNSSTQITDDSKTHCYPSFKDLLSQSDCSYQDLLDNEVLITEVLRRAAHQLDNLRKSAPNAGGLIVTTSVSHARRIAFLLQAEFNETAVIATYIDDNPLATIRQFRDSSSKWIISVGMISEGTNLPRLQVCCYLTRVKTELYFRQVLGRILRTTGESGEKGYLFMPAAPTLIKWALRVSEDIPEANILSYGTIKSTTNVSVDSISSINELELKASEVRSEIDINTGATGERLPIELVDSQSTLAQSYEACINISELLSILVFNRPDQAALWS
ncbi:DEAD/DEAH box helicase family protein, partial [Microbulbifer sp. OS29]